MTASSILSELRKHERISPFQTIRIGAWEVYRGMEKNGNYSVSIGAMQIAGGRIPASADPERFPLRIAEAIVNEMNP